jgi:hypothetical protein
MPENGLAELYKFRADEYGVRHESMRQLEWRSNFQVYSGYAALAVAFSYVEAQFHGSRALGWYSIAAIATLYCTALYLSMRIQERLKFTRDMQNAYTDKLHDYLQSPKLDRPGDTQSLKHQYKWAWYAQLVLSSATAISLVVLVVIKTRIFCP